MRTVHVSDLSGCRAALSCCRLLLAQARHALLLHRAPLPPSEARLQALHCSVCPTLLLTDMGPQHSACGLVRRDHRHSSATGTLDAGLRRCAGLDCSNRQTHLFARLHGQHVLSAEQPKG